MYHLVLAFVPDYQYTLYRPEKANYSCRSSIYVYISAEGLWTDAWYVTAIMASSNPLCVDIQTIPKPTASAAFITVEPSIGGDKLLLLTYGVEIELIIV